MNVSITEERERDPSLRSAPFRMTEGKERRGKSGG